MHDMATGGSILYLILAFIVCFTQQQCPLPYYQLSFNGQKCIAVEQFPATHVPLRANFYVADDDCKAIAARFGFAGSLVSIASAFESTNVLGI